MADDGGGSPVSPGGDSQDESDGGAPPSAGLDGADGGGRGMARVLHASYGSPSDSWKAAGRGLQRRPQVPTAGRRRPPERPAKRRRGADAGGLTSTTDAGMGDTRPTSAASGEEAPQKPKKSRPSD